MKTTKAISAEQQQQTATTHSHSFLLSPSPKQMQSVRTVRVTIIALDF